MAAVTNLYPQYTGYTPDAKYVLADTQTVSAGGVTHLTVGGSAAKIDCGLNTVRHFDAVCDISTVDATTGDERSSVIIQGSNSSTFASGNVNLAERTFGDSTVSGESADNVGDERSVLSFYNVREGTVYQYVRAIVLNAGTSPSIIVNQVFCAPKQHG